MKEIMKKQNVLFNHDNRILLNVCIAGEEVDVIISKVPERL